ncbi:MAG: polysaccharide pyruvyl transferase CsaB [Clostridiales bacterium]|jgi:polysaccharide pyruvyl transferase CsaB|nr:polysaccharide pyruvyl transferase CsaB [Clostridiales bacterium]
MKHIVISGYYGFNNAGDEAILDSMITTLKSLASKQGEELRFTVLSANPAQTASRYGTDAIGRQDLPQILRTLRRADAFISGGGGLLQDATGRGFSILYYLGLVALARLLGKKTILYAQGIGPVKKPFNRFFMRLIANRASLIAVRDEGSLNELLRLGVTRSPVILTADPVFLLKPADPDGRAAEFLKELPPNKPVVGISVRSWHNEEETLREISIAADLIARDLSALTVLVPMHYPGDLAVSDKLAALMKSETHILRENLTPRELLSVFTRFDLVLAMRLHALVFAAVSGVPMLGIGYDRKVDALLARLGLTSAGEPGQLNSIKLAGQALKRWGSREDLRQTLQEKSLLLHDEALSWAKKVLAFILDPQM